MNHNNKVECIKNIENNPFKYSLLAFRQNGLLL